MRKTISSKRIFEKCGRKVGRELFFGYSKDIFHVLSLRSLIESF